MLNKNGLKLKYIINTHAHFDHVGGNAALKKVNGAKLMIHEADNILLEKLTKQADIFGYDVTPSPPPDIMIKDGDKIKVGKLTLKVIHTPGHSPGGVCLLINDRIITGDTLFKQSIGRTDLPGGSYDFILRSIKEKLFTLDNKLLVFPGHGDSSTIGDEKRLNPYF